MLSNTQGLGDFDPSKYPSTEAEAIKTPGSSFREETETPFKPLKYGSFKDRYANLQDKLNSPEGVKEIYYPPCQATKMSGKISHFFKTTFHGTFLQTYDAHLVQVMKKKKMKDPSELKTINKAIATTRAGVNITGKTILGISVVGSVVGTVALGTAGLIGGACLSKDEGGSEAAAYVGACVGCAAAGVICTGGAFIGSALIACTEPDLTVTDRFYVVGAGTGITFALAMYTAAPIIDAGQTVSEFKYLQAGDTRGFLYLHCLGMPT